MSSKENATQKLNMFVIIETLICLGVVYTICTVKPEMTSLIFTMSFIILFIKYIGDLFKKKELENLDYLVFAIVGISGINVMINSLMKSKAIGFEYLNVYFIFVSTILLFRLACDIKLNKKTCNYIFFLQTIIVLVYVYAYNFIPQTVAQTTQGYLSLNFINPNLTAMFLLQSLLFMSIGVIYYKNIIIKLFCIILSIILYRYISETGARNALIAYFLFLVLSALFIFKQNFKLAKWFSFFLNAAPIIFVPVYLSYIKIIESAGWLDFLVSEGKSLDSRITVWNSYLELFDNSWITGNYAECNGNAHNSLFVVLMSYGIIILILVIIFNNMVSVKVSSSVSTRFQGVCISAIFAVVFMGLGEGALYSGGTGLYIFPATFIMLANCDENEISKPKWNFFKAEKSF